MPDKQYVIAQTWCFQQRNGVGYNHAPYQITALDADNPDKQFVIDMHYTSTGLHIGSATFSKDAQLGIYKVNVAVKSVRDISLHVLLKYLKLVEELQIKLNQTLSVDYLKSI